MKENKVLVLCIFILLCQKSFCQEYDSLMIPWSVDLQLKWSDFKGEAKVYSEMNAGCAAELKASGFWDGLPNFEITNRFDKMQSWTNDTTSKYLLDHEKLHFDIAELHARKMRKAVDSLRKINIKTYDPYSEIIKDLLKQRNRVDSRYDASTLHGMDATQQKIWQMEILLELDKLSGYVKE